MKCVVEVQVQTSDPSIFYLKISAKKISSFLLPSVQRFQLQRSFSSTPKAHSTERGIYHD